MPGKVTLLAFSFLFNTSFSFAQEPVSSPEESEDFQARITFVKGQVYIFEGDSETGFPAEEGAPVESGDRVETRARSQVELALEADSVMELGSNAIFTVDSLKREDSVFALSFGSLVAKFRSFAAKQRGYRILTPTAVAAVRGTEFGVDVGEEGTEIGVFDEGEVAVTTENEDVDETVLRAREETAVWRKGLETEVRGGRKELRRRKLEKFARGTARIKRLRARRTELRRRWRRLPPQARKELRIKALARHRAALEKMPSEQRRRMLVRMRKRAVRQKINRELWMKRRAGGREGRKGIRGKSLRRRGRQDAPDGTRPKERRSPTRIRRIRKERIKKTLPKKIQKRRENRRRGEKP